MIGVADVSQGELALSPFLSKNFDVISRGCEGQFAETLIARRAGVGKSRQFRHLQ
jgi:hypothetical protein